MKSTGYILNGEYHTGAPDVDALRDTASSTDKLYERDRQRENHAKDLLQPYDSAGQPNAAFIEQFPTEAKNYGFIN